MAATGFTPISTYYTTTASAVPTAGNLVNGELALNINTADGKLFYKDSAGVVQVLATRASASGSFTNLSYTGTLTGGTGVVNLGSGQFYKDASGLVGIGSIAPVSKLQIDGTSPINGVNATYVGSVQINESVGTAQAVGGLEFKSASFGSGYGWKIASLDSSGAQLTFNTRQNSATWSERMRIDSSGNVGIGITAPAYKLVASNAGAEGIEFGPGYSAGKNLFQSYNRSGSAYVELTSVASTFVYQISGTERMRIDSSGNLLVGTNIAGAGIGFDTRLAVDSTGETSVIKSSAGASAFALRVWNSGTTGDNLFIGFGTEAAYTSRGSITYNRAGGLTAYNVTSDYRAKDIIGAVLDSGEIIDSVPVYMGKMKDATQARPMFIAHETPSYAHTGIKDAVDKDGKPVYQQMDASSLVPVLWAEVQSLRKRLAILESK
jgi:hypothetical protein